MIKTFVINLKRRKDRLKQLDIPFEFEVHTAIDGMDLEGFGKMSGHIGCLKSHIELLENIKNSGLEQAIIFEDDVVLCEGFVKKLGNAIYNLPGEWDLLYLGGHNLLDPHKYSEGLDYAENVLTTHAYMINAKFIDTLLSFLKSREWKVDVLFAEALHMGNCFICSPVLAWQRDGFSDILHKETSNKHLL